MNNASKGGETRIWKTARGNGEWETNSNEQKKTIRYKYIFALRSREENMIKKVTRCEN